MSTLINNTLGIPNILSDSKFHHELYLRGIFGFFRVKLDFPYTNPRLL